MTKKRMKSISILMLVISSLGIFLIFFLMWNDLCEQQFTILLKLCFVGIVCSVAFNVMTFFNFKK